MDINELSPRLTLQLSKNHNIIMDEEGARLLILIDTLGSILAASKKMEIPYSRAWEYISKVERFLGIRIIESKRGGRKGGGTKLTQDGEKLVNRYLSEYKKHLNRELNIREIPAPIKKMFIYAGSNDILLEHIFGMMMKEGIAIEKHWIGSLRGLASLVLDECNLTGIHLLDIDTGEYNVSYIKKYTPTENIILIRGYGREIGFITREEMTYDNILEEIIKGKLRIINRNRGSGTRLIIEAILNKEAIEQKLNADEMKKKIKGYSDIVYTHLDTARKIALREADVGIGLRTASQIYKLKFIHIAWEKFDFATKKSKATGNYIRKFLKVLKSKEINRIMRSYEGYRAEAELGKILEV